MASDPTPASTIARSAASAAAATMTSRVLGLVRDQVLAYLFGTSAAMDAYNVAFRIPNLLRDLFAEGAMSAAFVPTFTRHMSTRGKQAAWRLGNLVLNALLLVTTALVVLGIVFAEPLVRLLADEEFTSVPGNLELTVQLARVMMPTLAFVALAAALMGMLNSLRHFFVPALSPAMFNVVNIVCAFAVVPLMTPLGLHPIVGIAIGSLLGGVAQLALQWPTLRREGFSYQPVLDWKDEGLRRVLVLMGPGTIGLAATQINLIVSGRLATGEGEGNLSALNYAFRLMYLPIGLFGVSIATAVLPAVSRQVTAEDKAGARGTVADGLSLMLMLNVPATIGLMVLATPIVRLAFERGEFGPASTLTTAAALQYYAVGLIGYSIVRIASPTFYALGQNRIPVIVSVVTVLLNAALSLVLVRVMGNEGLALATSIAALFNATTLFVLLRQRLGGIHEGRLAGSVMRIAIATAAMGSTAYGVNLGLERLLPGSDVVSQIIRVFGAIGVAVFVLAAASWVLRIREFTDAMTLVTRRFRRSR